MNNTNTNFENTDLLQRLINAEVALQVQNELNDINKPINNSELFEALARAQANFDQVKKSGKANIPTKSGGNYSYNFAKLSDVLAATVPALNAEGIFFSQKPNYSLSSNAPTLTIVSTLSHKSGASISYESIPLFYNMNDAKQAGSVMTYLRRYGACQILGIEGDDDDDAHVATMDNSSNYNNYKSNQQAAVTESKETETVTIPPAPKRDMSTVFQSGLESAKNYGATEEQLAEWQVMTHEEAIREMSTFVRDKASGK